MIPTSHPSPEEMARLTARIDTREIGPLFGLESTETATCDFVSALGITCEVCSDGEPLCLDFDAAWTDAPLLDGIVLE